MIYLYLFMIKLILNLETIRICYFLYHMTSCSCNIPTFENSLKLRKDYTYILLIIDYMLPFDTSIILSFIHGI